MVLSKLEKPAAIDRLDAIVQRSDAIMVGARRPGVELPPERVPILAADHRAHLAGRGGQAP